MSDHDKQDESSASGLYPDAVTQAKNELAGDQTKQSKCDKRLVLIILLIMFLVITQLVVLLSSSGVNESFDPAPVSDADVSLEDIKAVNNDLKEVMKSIEEINARPQPEEKITEVKKKTVPVKAVPVVVKKDKPRISHENAVVEVKKSEPVKNKTATLVPVVVNNKKEIAIEKTTTATIDTSSGYIKHDDKGDSLADDIEQWTCVYDAKTGLTWEVKSQEDAMRNSHNLYSWYDPKNKNLPGEPDGGRCKGGTDCDTNAYVQAMNEINYCGHNDWRLPTREQMQTLVDLSTDKSKVKINKQYFPQTMPSWYWTSSDEGNDDELAWYVLFRNGFALSDLKERPKHVRLVRENLSGV